MQSIEKVIPKLIIVMVITSMLYSLVILGAVDIFKLSVDGNKGLSFMARWLGSTVNNGLFIMPWVLLAAFFYEMIEIINQHPGHYEQSIIHCRTQPSCHEGKSLVAIHAEFK